MQQKICLGCHQPMQYDEIEDCYECNSDICAEDSDYRMLDAMENAREPPVDWDLIINGSSK